MEEVKWMRVLIYDIVILAHAGILKRLVVVMNLKTKGSLLHRICSPAVHFSPDEESGAAISIRFI
ncbi:hypothetical protein [Pedobacter psychrodurus]|uniref:hypothetical protein n=1 Tax=Pedobacter psychrodurus TaxID=2530456 RepID=UPI002930EA95|nr:hypothetical protein [Pedobacter psychrodurus]